MVAARAAAPEPLALGEASTIALISCTTSIGSWGSALPARVRPCNTKARARTRLRARLSAAASPAANTVPMRSSPKCAAKVSAQFEEPGPLVHPTCSGKASTDSFAVAPKLTGTCMATRATCVPAYGPTPCVAAWLGLPSSQRLAHTRRVPRRGRTLTLAYGKMVWPERCGMALAGASLR